MASRDSRRTDFDADSQAVQVGSQAHQDSVSDEESPPKQAQDKNSSSSDEESPPKLQAMTPQEMEIVRKYQATQLAKEVAREVEADEKAKAAEEAEADEKAKAAEEAEADEKAKAAEEAEADEKAKAAEEAEADEKAKAAEEAEAKRKAEVDQRLEDINKKNLEKHQAKAAVAKAAAEQNKLLDRATKRSRNDFFNFHAGVVRGQSLLAFVQNNVESNHTNTGSQFVISSLSPEKITDLIKTWLRAFHDSKVLHRFPKRRLQEAFAALLETKGFSNNNEVANAIWRCLTNNQDRWQEIIEKETQCPPALQMAIIAMCIPQLVADDALISQKFRQAHGAATNVKLDYSDNAAKWTQIGRWAAFFLERRSPFEQEEYVFTRLVQPMIDRGFFSVDLQGKTVPDLSTLASLLKPAPKSKSKTTPAKSSSSSSQNAKKTKAKTKSKGKKTPAKPHNSKKRRRDPSPSKKITKKTKPVIKPEPTSNSDDSSSDSDDGSESSD